jgi:hypothetical protein
VPPVEVVDGAKTSEATIERAASGNEMPLPVLALRAKASDTLP